MRMPAGRVNKKRGSDATVAIMEIRKGEAVAMFIIHVAALLWAATQVPEITVAIQSRLKAGFRSAVQVEFWFIIGAFTRYREIPVSEFQNFCSER